tara:strand:+ start:4066 stop:6120 length:2055 start_codon:yes stop_codon:yes gene_type:complete
MRKIFIVLIAIITSSIGNAQIDLSEPDRKNCGTAILQNQMLLDNPLMQLEIEEKNKFAKAFAKNYVSNKGVISYTIPVVYHVIHDNGAENVSKADIEASVANLNEDYQQLNADLSQVISSFTGIIADVELQFRLAHIDPSGNCTEGITRTVSPLTYAMDESVKNIVNWDTKKYLNIWVGQTIASGAGGYSYLPSNFLPQYRNGIVIRSAQLGNSMTHEVGHFLDLPHLWGGSNTPGVSGNCLLDDGINDTPLCLGAQTCNTSLQTCGSLDNVQNYMEYSGCSRMFTEGQKLRMHAALNSSVGSRNTLHAPANLIATGVANPYAAAVCAPVAGFNYNRDYICEGSSVTFTDDSYNAIPTAWNWSFSGGNPATSTVSNPTIVYNTAGVYDVTHVPGSGGLNASPLIKNNIITVSSLVADYSGPIIEGFESLSQINTDWIIENEEGFGWEKTTVASTTGSSSMRIRNYSNGSDTKEDVLISPAYDISSVTTKTMTFKQAFAKKISSNSDRLYIYTSIDCGETWMFGLLLTSANLSSVNSTQTADFVPVSSDWVTRTIDLSSISTATNVRFKFEFKSGGGNNIYIDDINIGGAVGVAGFSNVANFKIYPNPTNSSAQISFNLVKDVKALSIKVRNAVGQEVTSVINQQAFNAGTYNLKIDEERKLASGIYFVEFNADNNIKVQKLIVQ